MSIEPALENDSLIEQAFNLFRNIPAKNFCSIYVGIF